jgi:hypothetical protein
MRRVSFGLLVLLMAVPARADILPPESKWISHVARFEKLGDHPGYVFYVYPRDLGRGKPGNSSVRVPESGEVAISGLNPLAAREGVYLFAIPKELHGPLDQAPKEEWFEKKTEGVLKSGRLAYPVRSVSKSDKRDKIVTTYGVKIEKGELKLTEIKPEPKPEAKPGEQPTGGPPLEADAAVSEARLQSRLPWIMGGSATGAALVCAAWLAVRKKV